MVKATFVLGSTLKYQGFTLAGHTGYAAHGEDIVCAGVSALALSVAQALEEFLGEKVSIIQGEDGWLKVVIKETQCSAELLCRAETLVKTLEIGLRNISRSYPGSLEMMESEVFPDDSL
ncbi:MAG: ribosomal-processing cysteine protease Prp [Firmicutes bacterium]|nr:ribosomal-processing cysteine protease Prp [Bacillota bacterium]